MPWQPNRKKDKKKGKRGRSSTGSLTEALNVTRITTAGPAREVATSSQQKKTHGCNVGKEGGWNTERVTARAVGPCSLVWGLTVAEGSVAEQMGVQILLHPKVFERHRPYPGLAGLEVLIPSCRNSACGNECLLVLLKMMHGSVWIRLLYAKVVGLQCCGLLQTFSPQMAGWKTQPLQPTRCHPRFESTQWLKC